MCRYIELQPVSRQSAPIPYSRSVPTRYFFDRTLLAPMQEPQAEHAGNERALAGHPHWPQIPKPGEGDGNRRHFLHSKLSACQHLRGLEQANRRPSQPPFAHMCRLDRDGFVATAHGVQEVQTWETGRDTSHFQ
jgi:hypothetical protein